MSVESQKVRWGILGPGEIAKAFFGGAANSRTGRVVALGTRDANRPGLAETFPGTRIHQGHAALLADPEVDAIYIATPHPSHAEWAIKAAEAGKHVLCEKPMALSAAQAGAMINAARKAGTFFGEAFMYRLYPQTRRLIELIAEGAIGEVRMIKSSFGFAMSKFMPEHRLYANDMAGGGILDVGGYPVSMVRLIASAAAGVPLLEPERVSGVAHLGVTGVDEWASAVLLFPGGIVSEVSCSVSVNQENVLRILGTKGRIEVPNFWFANGNRDQGLGRIDIHKDGKVETLSMNGEQHLYSYEVDGAGDAILSGRQQFEAPGMTWDDSLGNLRVQDKWRADAGLVYGIETPERATLTAAGRPLERRGAQIGTRTIPGLDRGTSPVAMGFEYFDTFGGAAVLLDRFYERGGNLFDTAWMYGNGQTEKIFGAWQSSRGLKRDDYTLIGKGAHSPLVYPDVIGTQLAQSLDRLKTDYVDVYFMHRDNPIVPVEEFVDAMDAEFKAGRIRSMFGGSNWTRERMDAAIAYARRTGKQAPTALSNNFSLAEMVAPMWAGCVACSDDAWKAWLTANGMPDFAWSSQGRGFFTERAGRDKHDDAEIVHSWYSDKNFARRDRAIALAKELKCTPINIALAYVLCQPLPVVPLIGPRTLEELEDSLSAIAIKLSPEQVRWLETGN